jgi:hypothetical protein
VLIPIFVSGSVARSGLRIGAGGGPKIIRTESKSIHRESVDMNRLGSCSWRLLSNTVLYTKENRFLKPFLSICPSSPSKSIYLLGSFILFGGRIGDPKTETLV